MSYIVLFSFVVIDHRELHTSSQKQKFVWERKYLEQMRCEQAVDQLLEFIVQFRKLELVLLLVVKNHAILIYELHDRNSP